MGCGFGLIGIGRGQGRGGGHGRQEIVPFRHWFENNLNSSNICKPGPTISFQKVIAIMRLGHVVILMVFWLDAVASRRKTIGRRPSEFIQVNQVKLRWIEYALRLIPKFLQCRLLRVLLMCFTKWDFSLMYFGLVLHLSVWLLSLECALTYLHSLAWAPSCTKIERAPL